MMYSLEFKRQQVERLLETDLSVAEWCRRNDIKPSTMYGWIIYFTEHEPELFGDVENIVPRTERRWFESTRLNVKKAHALALTREEGFVVLDKEVLESSVSFIPERSQHKNVVANTSASLLEQSSSSNGMLQNDVPFLSDSHLTDNMADNTTQNEYTIHSAIDPPPLTMICKDCRLIIPEGIKEEEIAKLVKVVRYS